MFKIQVQLSTLQNHSLLKQVLNKLDLEKDYKNVYLWFTKDWVNGTLPEKYKQFNPDFSQMIELELPDEYLILGFEQWIKDN